MLSDNIFEFYLIFPNSKRKKKSNVENIAEYFSLTWKKKWMSAFQS